MFESWLIRLYRAKVWVQWILVIPLFAAGSIVAALIATFLQVSISRVLDVPEFVGELATNLLFAFSMAAYAVLGSIFAVLVLPRWRRGYLRVIVSLSVLGVSVALVATYLDLADSKEIDWERTLSDLGMGLGQIWLFFRYRVELLEYAENLREEARATDVHVPHGGAGGPVAGLQDVRQHRGSIRQELGARGVSVDQEHALFFERFRTSSNRQVRLLGPVTEWAIPLAVATLVTMKWGAIMGVASAVTLHLASALVAKPFIAIHSIFYMVRARSLGISTEEIGAWMAANPPGGGLDGED